MSTSHTSFVLGPCGVRDLAAAFELFLVLGIESSNSLGFRIVFVVCVIHFQIKLLVEVCVSNILALRRVKKFNIVSDVFVKVAKVLRFFADFTNVAVLKFLNGLASFQNGLLILVTYQPNFRVVLKYLGKVILNFLSILILI